MAIKSNIQDKSQPFIRRRTLISYGALAMPITLADIPIAIYLPAFYAKEVGLSLGMIAIVFTLARTWDGFSDLLIGRLSDKFTSRFGRRKPWVIVGSPLLVVAVWCLFNPPKDAGLVYLGVWVTLFYTAHTAVKIPYWTWGAELATSYEQRGRIVAFREGFSMVGFLLFAAAPLLLLPEDAPISEALHLLSTTTIILIAFAIFPLGKCVPEIRKRLVASAE